MKRRITSNQYQIDLWTRQVCTYLIRCYCKSLFFATTSFCNLPYIYTGSRRLIFENKMKRTKIYRTAQRYKIILIKKIKSYNFYLDFLSVNIDVIRKLYTTILLLGKFFSWNAYVCDFLLHSLRNIIELTTYIHVK